MVLEPWLPTPLELSAWLGVWLDGGVDCAVFALLPSDELTDGFGWFGLLPIAPAEDEGCCCDAVWSDVMAPDVPPAVAVCELPWFREADELQVSASFVMPATVIAWPAFDVAVLLPELVWALAEAELDGEPLAMIVTCWPTWLCSWLLSPCN